MSKNFIITPLTPAIGAVISNVDLTQNLNVELFKVMQNALFKYQVLFFRGQPIEPKQQKKLASYFGTLHVHPIYPHVPDCQEIMILDTDINNLPDNDNWHTDVTFIQAPPMGAVLAAKKIPDMGGDTLWASGIAAFNGLSDSFKNLIQNLYAEHDFIKSFPEHRHNQTPQLRQRWKEAKDKNPPVMHPVMRTHPVTGQRALFVNEGFTTRIVGLPQKESDALLTFLFQHIQKPEYQVRWQWQEGDIVIWDNQVTQHYATIDYLPHRRVMHRATIIGGIPQA